MGQVSMTEKTQSTRMNFLRSVNQPYLIHYLVHIWIYLILKRLLRSLVHRDWHFQFGDVHFCLR